MDDNSFENYPGSNFNSEPSAESLARAEEWETAMGQDDVPAFAGETFIGEVPEVAEETPDTLSEDQNNQGLTDAAAIVNYGLNAAAKQYGVETVVQKIKSFNASGSDNPIRDLFLYLGVDTPSEFQDVALEGEAARAKEADFYENSPASPTSKNRSAEGAFKAIEDMKELISEVEGADPRYAELRAGAKASGKGYFEYAVGSSTNRDLTDLFGVLAAQPEVGAPDTPESSEDPLDTPESSDRETLNLEIITPSE